MDFLLEALTNWLKEMLVGGIMSNLSGMFDSVNQQVADISVQVGQTPQGWNGSIFNMIENLSNSFPPSPQSCGSGKDFMQERLDREQPREQRYKNHTNNGYTSTGHKLLHALRFGARVVVAVTFQQVDDTPDTKTSTQSDNESLKNGNCLFKKCHK